MKKKIIGMILTCSMCLAVFFKSEQVEIKKIKDAIETQEIEAAKTVILSTEELSALYSYKNDYNTDTCLNLSVADATRLMKIAVVEDNTDIKSQANIMLVILNRVESSEFPDSIEEVIKQKGQFSTVTNGSYAKAEPDLNSHLALCMIEKGEIQSDALFFEASWAKGTWQSSHKTYLFSAGGTRYYK